MKNILKNSALIVFSIALCLGFVEGALRVNGRYHNLADRMLQPSTAIWEAPANGVWFSKHPDLNVPIERRYDRDGVRNHSELSTSEKQKIIGFFGDSFTENSQIEDRFTFTSILDIAANPSARVVNYGVDGYGLDQAYLRYKKYERHDIEHVVYVFYENDLRNLYETGLTKIAQNGDIEFAERRNPLYRLLGRLHVTYLVITAYYKAHALLDESRTGEWKGPSERQLLAGEWKGPSERQLFAARYARSFDEYSGAIETDFLSPVMSTETLQLSQKFLLLLEKWKREVEASNRTFTVLVLPWKLDDAIATKLLRNFSGRVVHSVGNFENCDHCMFSNDGHWNEYGNEKIAEFILSDSAFPFHNCFRTIETAGLTREIDAYYRSADDGRNGGLSVNQ
jgi:hypothetical protein